MSAVFDGSAADSYATVLVGPSAAYTVTVVARIPAASYAAIGGASAEMLVVGDPTGDFDGIYTHPSVPDYASDQHPVAVTPGPSPDAPVVLTVGLSAPASTTWTVDWGANGTSLFTPYTITMPNTSAQQLQVNVGALFPATVPGETYEILSVEVRNAADTVIFFDNFASDDFSEWDSATGATSFADVGGIVGGGVRVGVAFDDVTFEPNPSWTWLTDTNNLVASSSLRRGRQFEFDKTDTMTGTVTVNDPNGVLDPTNSSGPYYGKIEPLLQLIVQYWNPVTAQYFTRARGFIEEYNYTVGPSTYVSGIETKGVTRLEIQVVGIFAPLTAIEMQPDGTFGDIGGPEGVIFFDNANVDDRINQVFGNAGIDPEFTVVFSGNISMPESSYSPSQNVMEVVQDCADAEFPTVSNIYEDRFGRAVFHGRLAKFDPVGVAAGASPGAWDFHHWKCGDGQAVAASLSDTAQVRRFSFNRGLAKIFNQALCTPQGIDNPSTVPGTSDIPGQVSTDAPSIAQYGIRSWSAENLKVESGTTTMNDALAETKLYADYIVDNYAEARNRVTELTFMSLDPSDPRAAANWDVICQNDISDLIDATVTDPGGGGFNAEPFFIEGITEDAKPLNGRYAMVTTSLDVSPQAYFNDNPFS